MLKVEKKQEAKVTSLTLSGVIDERIDFDQLLGPLTGSVKINLRRIERINSVGVKNWVRYFGGLSDSGVELVYEECSPQIVEQINLVLNFVCGGTIASVLMPFNCSQCHSAFTVGSSLEDLRNFKGQFPAPPCPKCSGETNFDDIEEEYFAFMKRQKD